MTTPQPSDAAIQTTLQGVVTNPDEAIANAPLDGRVHRVCEWKHEERAGLQGDALLKRVDEIYALFCREYHLDHDAKRARAVCRRDADNASFEAGYRRFFALVTDELTATTPGRMDLVRRMVRVTNEMHYGRVSEAECRQRILDIAKEDMERRRSSACEAACADPPRTTRPSHGGV